MSTLYYLENFNNYYNRTIKKASDRSLSPFMEFVLKVDTDFNFNPNDHVTTTIVVNYTYRENGIEYEISDDRNIDYILVSEDDETVKSKWFVTDRIRTLGGQWALSLRRDLISDYYNVIMESPIFIEKGIPQNISDKYIFNSENMQFNQIKVGEQLLKDKYNTPWIVGYMARNYYEAYKPSSGDAPDYIEFKRNIEKAPTIEYSYSEIQNYINMAGGILYSNANRKTQGLRFVISNDSPFSKWVYQNDNSLIQTETPQNSCAINTVYSNFLGADLWINIFQRRLRQTNQYYMADGDLVSYLPGYIYPLWIQELNSLNGQFIKNTDAEGPRFFSVNLYSEGSTTISINPPAGSNVYTGVKDIFYRCLNDSAFEDGNELENKFTWRDTETNTVYIDVPCTKYSISVNDETALITARAFIGNENSNKTNLTDAPYVMFCLPYENIRIYRKNDEEPEILFNSQGSICKEAATAIATYLGASGQTSYIYDLQLLPYCPIPGLLRIDEQGGIDISNLSTRSYGLIRYRDADEVYGDNTNCGIVFFADRSSFRINIPVNYTVSSDVEEFKIENETKFCRLVSPNYSGAFQFSPTKNYGLSNFEINCTYKPYQPYIHVNPTFNSQGLYGGDFNDNRGLICSGDFSIPQIGDRWVDFQIQNKSYAESFQRQIENMEVNNAVQREREIWGAAGGSVSGTAGGTVAAGMMGGPVGAAIGGTVGGVASIAGGIRDIQLADKLREEAIDYTKDQFGYSLRNIQALPNTMSKTSAFDINNKLYPFLEIYDCSETEKEALRLKIRYNGMTIMAIGNIRNYISNNSTEYTYIKGSIIRFEGSAESHEVVEIANELNKGVFI